MFDPTYGEHVARIALADPGTTAEDLAIIAQAFPGLVPAVLAHPGCRPDLAEWLQTIQPPPGPPGAPAPALPRPEQSAVTGPPVAAKKSRTPVVAAVAGVGVVALVAVGAWFVLGRDSGSSSSSAAELAPDYLTKPTLGTPVVVADMLDGDFAWSEVLELVDARHMLVWGANYYPPSTSKPSDGSLVLGMLNLEAKSIDWQVDLCDAAGFDVGLPVVLPMGDGSFVVGVTDVAGSGNKLVVVVSAAGKVTGTRDVGALAGGAHGYVALMDPDAPGTIVVAKSSDIGSDVWSAAAVEGFGRYQISSDDAGHVYVQTADGMVDGRTGAKLGFGQDAGVDDETHAVMYFAAPDGTVFRADTDASDQLAPTSTLTRINPKDGTDLWASPINPHDDLALTPDHLVVTDGATVEGYRKSDGTKAWSTAVTDAKNIVPLASGMLAVICEDRSVTIIGPRDGKKITTIKDVRPYYGTGIPSGKQVFYVEESGSLMGYSATGDDDSALWTLDLGTDSATMHAGWGRLFLVTMSYDGSILNNKGTSASVVEVLKG
ncbi:MAG: PQQ-like beta-propeller repeat protein [Micrococcales bacterium]|nr:PQQ-like beta-propeller repeat protein [Micrococcales bacterium]